MVGAFSAYDPPSVEALVWYLHASIGFPVKSTWITAIKEVNYSTSSVLTYTNVAKYCPSANETVKGHLTQNRQGVHSTKHKLKSSVNTLSTLMPDSLTPIYSNETQIWNEPISNIYTDDTGRFAAVINTYWPPTIFNPTQSLFPLKYQ